MSVDDLRDEYDWIHMLHRKEIGSDERELTDTLKVEELSDDIVESRLEHKLPISTVNENLQVWTDDELDWSEVDIADDYDGHPDYDYPATVIASNNI